MIQVHVTLDLFTVFSFLIPSAADYYSVTSVRLTFDAVTLSVCLQIAIRDDHIREDHVEYFTVIVEAVSLFVDIGPGSAVVVITDDEPIVGEFDSLSECGGSRSDASFSLILSVGVPTSRSVQSNW